jgi:homoserine trans-succinylase
MVPFGSKYDSLSTLFCTLSAVGEALFAACIVCGAPLELSEFPS